MNTNELKSVTLWAKALGLTAYDVQRIKTEYGYTNNQLINYLNYCFIKRVVI